MERVGISGVRGRNRSEPVSGEPDGLIPAPRFGRHSGLAQSHERGNICPSTNAKLAATSPEIICPFGIRAGSLTGVPDSRQEHQHRMNREKAFQQLLSPEVARRYRRGIVRKVWIKH